MRQRNQGDALRGEGAVNVGTDRFDRDINARKSDIMFGKLCHRAEIDVLDVGKRNFSVVAIVSLELAGIVIAGNIEIVEARNDPVVNDLDDVRLLQIFRHSANDRAILCQRRRTETFAIAFDHFRQIKIDLITRPVLDKGQSVTVLDLTAHRWNPDRCLRAAAKLSSPFGAMRHLYPPKPEAKGANAHQHEQRKKLNPQTGIDAASAHWKRLLSGR